MKKTLATIALVLVAGLGYSEIKFVKGSLNDAITKARAEKKPVMIDFITDWCRWCDTLDARTYSDVGVADYINKNVVAIKIDAEKGEGIEIAKKYNVRGYPTILLIHANGEEIDRMLGFVEPGPFLNTVTDYVNGRNTVATLIADVKAKPNDPEVRYKLARRYDERYDANEAAEQYAKLLELDPRNALGHREDALYAVAMSKFKEEKDTSQLLAFMNEFPDSPKNRQVLSTLIRSSLKAKDGAAGKKYFMTYSTKWPEEAGMMNNYAWTCAEEGLNLEHATEVAKKAVTLAKKDSERAMYLDTHATVEFTRGNIDEAIRLQQQALDLLKDATPKQRKEYEETMAKFKAAKEKSERSGM